MKDNKEVLTALKDMIKLASSMAIFDKGDGSPIGDDYDAWRRLDKAEIIIGLWQCDGQVDKGGP